MGVACWSTTFPPKPVGSQPWFAFHKYALLRVRGVAVRMSDVSYVTPLVALRTSDTRGTKMNGGCKTPQQSYLAGQVSGISHLELSRRSLML